MNNAQELINLLKELCNDRKDLYGGCSSCPSCVNCNKELWQNGKEELEKVGLYV